MKNITKLYQSFFNFLTNRSTTNNWGLLVLCFNFVLLLQILPSTATAQIPTASEPVCAYCGARITRGESHKPGCPYYSNQSGSSAEHKDNSWNINLEHRHSRAQEINEKGNDALRTGNYRKAISSYNRALWYSPFDETIKKNLASAKESLKSNRENNSRTKPIITKPINTVVKKPVISKDLKTIQVKVGEEQDIYKSQLDKLRKNMNGVVPPLSKSTINIHEGVILGTTNTEECNKIVKLNLKSPFNDSAQHVFATSVDSSNWDFKRAVLDNFTYGQYTINQTAYGRELAKKLNGTHFDRLIAHSNGGTVADALIQENIITVEELDIIGGDHSYVNWSEYNALIASGKVKRIVVWINPGDPVPMGTSLAGLFHTVKFAKYLGEYIANEVAGSQGGHNVEYHILRDPKYQCGEGKFGPHGIDCYFNNMKKYFNN